jgi:xylulokinase
MTELNDALIVGVDAGTSHIRALIFSLDGRVVASGRAPMPIKSPAPGEAEFDPESLWQKTVIALREAVGKLANPKRIVAIAAASIGESGIALDSSGNPVVQSLAWYDKRPLEEMNFLIRQFGELALPLRTGMRLSPIAGLCKILWLKHKNPDAFSRVHHWLNVTDYIAWRLSGEMATDYSLACRMLTFDIQTKCWAEDILKELNIPSQIFPLLTASGKKLGKVIPEAAEVTGLPRHCIVATGGHDHVVGALPTGAFRSGTLLNSIGTAEAVMLTVEEPLQDETLIRYGFEQGMISVDEAMYFILGGLTTAGGAIEWFRTKIANNAGHDELIAEAEQVLPGSLGVCFVPHLRISSQPDSDPRARGTFLGLSTDTNQSMLYRAVLEGIALDIHNIVKSLSDIKDIPSIKQVNVTGGGSQNNLLLRIKASVLNHKLNVITLPDAVSLGAACLAGIGGGVFKGLDESLAAVARPFKTVSPEESWIETYQQVFETRFLPALAALKRLRNDTE